jgi:GDSL-like Lipase/Acylhydrolase
LCRFALTALVLSGCATDEGPPLTATPDHSSLFGQIDVTLSGDIASLGDIRSVTVGGTLAYDLQVTPTALTVRLQGAPRPGRADVIVEGSRGRSVRRGLITYDAPPSGVPLTFMAFGASLTQGTQSDGIDPHTQTLGVSGQLARALGVYLGLPLFVPSLAPPLEPSDFNADCTQKPDTGFNINTITDTLTDPATGLFDMRRGRIDWTLTPRNVAIGGSKVSDTLNGGRGTVALLEHIVEDPTIDPDDAIGPEYISQIARVEKLDPEIGFATDILANDLDASVTSGDDLHPELITDLSTVQPLLQLMTARLGKLHGQFFIANMPSLTFVPNVAALRTARLAAGTDTAESFDAKVKTIDDATDAMNAALVDAMQPYDNLHLVDFKAEVESVAGGLDVGGEHLTTQMYGGLISLDGLHFTDTGYALYANVFLHALNAQFGTSLPDIDLATVHASDALSPSALKADGLTCVP